MVFLAALSRGGGLRGRRVMQRAQSWAGGLTGSDVGRLADGTSSTYHFDFIQEVGEVGAQLQQRGFRSSARGDAAASGERLVELDKDAWGLHPHYMNANFVRAQYAVRGELYLRAEELRKKGTNILYCNIGNPQSVGQQPNPYYRNVLSLCLAPHLLENPDVTKVFPAYAVSKAKEILAKVPGGLGAYSDSRGVPGLTKEVARFISRRDGHEADPSKIFLTDGASVGVKMILSALIKGQHTGILCPVPQYPLYSASLAMLDGTLMPYYLQEEKGWTMDLEGIERTIREYKDRKIEARALAFINPGNPTGQCLSMSDIQDVIKLAYKHKLVLMADEVYQENVYDDKRPFVSARKALLELGGEWAEKQQLVSFHTISKGTIGECGLRGGYFELTNVPAEGEAEIYKVASINLCPNIPAQVVTSLYVNPPEPGEPGHEDWKAHRDTIYDGLKRKALTVVDGFNKMEGVSCQAAEGAMYTFPSITFPPKAMEAAKAMGKPADVMYCLALLEATGIATVPGTGFGQKPGSFHVRTTFLPSEDKVKGMMDDWAHFHKDFMAKYK